MTTAHKHIALEIKAVDDGGSFEGLGAVFHNVDSTGDIIAPGAFKGSIPSFLTDGFVGGLNHNWDQPIGRFTAAYETRDGLFVKAKLSDVPEGNRVRTLMQDGVVKKLSIGYETIESKMLTPDDTKAYWQANGYQPSEGDARRAGRPVRLLTAIKLHEVSPVTMPANDRAMVLGVKGEMLGDLDEPMAHAALGSLMDGLCCFLDACIDDEGLDGGTARLDRMQAGTDEFRAALPAVAGLIVEDDVEEGIYDAMPMPAMEMMAGPDVAALKAHIESILSGRADPAPSFARTSRKVDSALGEFTALARKFTQQRQKAGRVLSAANRQRISAAMDGMNACMSDLQALLDMTAPEPPKSDAEALELRRRRFLFQTSLALQRG